ncbi:unnamed protein product [Rhodiola kirilowii]
MKKLNKEYFPFTSEFLSVAYGQICKDRSVTTRCRFGFDLWTDAVERMTASAGYVFGWLLLKGLDLGSRISWSQDLFEKTVGIDEWDGFWGTTTYKFYGPLDSGGRHTSLLKLPTISTQVLVAAAVSAGIGQLLKPFSSSWLYGKDFSLSSAIQAGGFPSTHSSAVIATATSIALERGFADPIFGMAVVYASLVMYDAQASISNSGIRAKVKDRKTQFNGWPNEVSAYDGKSDFGVWSMKMKALLSHYKVSIALEEKIEKWSEEQKKKKSEIEDEAYNLLVLSLADSVLRRFKSNNNNSNRPRHDKRKDVKPSNNNSAGKETRKCYYCGNVGHLRKQCNKWQNRTNTNANHETNVATTNKCDGVAPEVLSVTDRSSADQWILDSGCFFQMCPHAGWFEGLSEIAHERVFMADSNSCQVIGIGVNNGKLIVSKGNRVVLTARGIVRHRTVRASPQQNGVAERMNRTLLDKARGLLFTSPNLGHLRVFGCAAYAHTKDDKLDPRTIPCIFSGYLFGVKGYRLWDYKSKGIKIIISKDVIFDENAFPYKSLSAEFVLHDNKPVSIQFEVESSLPRIVNADNVPQPIENENDNVPPPKQSDQHDSDQNQGVEAEDHGENQGPEFDVEHLDVSNNENLANYQLVCDRPRRENEA